jgi:hypothetical protein
MGFFSNILEKLGMGSAAPASAEGAAAGTAVDAAVAGQDQAAVPVALNAVDVVALMAARAASSPQKLNWQTSIVDLLKLLDLDSSLAARKELAGELSCPADLLDDSAKMNMWLHKEVLNRIAANGGNIPADLLG